MFKTVRTAYAVLAGICLVVSASASARAAEAPRIIRVYNPSTDDPGARAAVLQHAAAVLSEAGVEASWLDCSGDARDTQCEAVRGPRDLIIRIVPRPMGPTPSTQDSVSTGSAVNDPDLQLGFSTFETSTRRGVLATIFHERVLAVATRAGLDYRVLLARAVAHEVGHLLLPSSGHGTSGLMRAVWTDAELALNRPADWVFAPAERDLLHAEAHAGTSR